MCENYHLTLLLPSALRLQPFSLLHWFWFRSEHWNIATMDIREQINTIVEVISNKIILSFLLKHCGLHSMLVFSLKICLNDYSQFYWKSRSEQSSIKVNIRLKRLGHDFICHYEIRMASLMCNTVHESPVKQ